MMTNEQQPKWTEQQQQIIQDVRSGHNVVISGPGGTGKSYLVKYLCDHILPSKSTARTATTGIAAVNIGAQTIHSFSGIGNAEGSIEDIVARSKRAWRTAQNWQESTVLFIDEFSMLSADIFDALNEIAKYRKRNQKPFGGVQLIMVGDPLQLPPISKDGEEKAKYCFDGVSWPECNFKVHILTEVFRQTEKELVEALCQIRLGRVTPEANALFKACTSQGDNKEQDGIQHTKLYSTKKNVDAENQHRLMALPGETHTYTCVDSGESPYLEQLQRNSIAPEKLSLKVGAQVMLIKNLDVSGGLANGSRGVVTEFVEMTQPSGKNKTKSEAKEAKEIVPKVKFLNGREVVIGRLAWTVDRFGVPKATRVQIPLILAWSISVHKSQGMSLDAAWIAMQDMFAEGQAYVALSRVRTYSGLRLQCWLPAMIKANPRALEWEMAMVQGKEKEKEQEKGAKRPLPEDGQGQGPAKKICLGI